MSKNTAFSLEEIKIYEDDSLIVINVDNADLRGRWLVSMDDDDDDGA